MANKYHISPETGNPNICRATKRGCPIGDADSEHYSTRAEAKKAYEASMADKTIGSFSRKKDRLILPDDSKERLQMILDHYDKFPKPAVGKNGRRIAPVATDKELEEEEQEINQELHGYTAEENLKTRIDRHDVLEAENEGEYAVMAKEPSYYEQYYSTDLARKFLKMPKREKTDSDKTAVRLSHLELRKAYQKEFDKNPNRGYIQSTPELDEITALHKKIRERDEKDQKDSKSR